MSKNSKILHFAKNGSILTFLARIFDTHFWPKIYHFQLLIGNFDSKMAWNLHFWPKKTKLSNKIERFRSKIGHFRQFRSKNDHFSPFSTKTQNCPIKDRNFDQKLVIFALKLRNFGKKWQISIEKANFWPKFVILNYGQYFNRLIFTKNRKWQWNDTVVSYLGIFRVRVISLILENRQSVTDPYLK